MMGLTLSRRMRVILILALLLGLLIFLPMRVALGLAGLRRVRPLPAARFGPVVQGTIRFNTYLSLALIATLAGPGGVERAALYLDLAVPLVNVISILALTAAAGCSQAGPVRTTPTAGARPDSAAARRPGGPQSGPDAGPGDAWWEKQ